ncbi:hypothetical protein COLO4_20207 [Corchorus olitorius]|uniref:F-box domain-containing protein n=1 Tax=Corchorus olitorius TaxID=93759 RepID=A0A1R3J195_9ROSI|nr:hypothetical protein COLO4_20207 [Corchorus olitorius]
MAGMYKIPKTTTTGRRTEVASKTPCLLPGDIVINILSRLPVKNLIRFKSVNKQWGNLISHPRFARMQMKQCENQSKRVLISTIPPLAIDYEAYSAGDCKAKFKLVYPTAFMKKGPKFGIKLVGSCNGLICLVIDNNELILWNPSTRESRELPKLPGSYAPDRFRFGFSFGFGFDASNDAYKVVQLGIPRVGDDDNALNSIKIEVLTLESNVWRRLQDLQSGLQLSGNGIFLYGQLHWIGKKAIAANLRSYVIVSFDLAIEKFHKAVPIPDHEERSISYPVLGVSGNCLFLFFTRGQSFYEGWITKEYDINTSSWTRMFNVGIDRLPGYRTWRRELCYTKTGQVLIDYDGMELVLYDPKRGTTQFLASTDWGSRLHSILYTESLVSPIMVKK